MASHPLLNGPLARYRARVAAGEMDVDVAQVSAAERLDALTAELRNFKPGRGWLSGLFSRQTTTPRGLYIHGKVGRGKTMLMDLFFEADRLQAEAAAYISMSSWPRRMTVSGPPENQWKAIRSRASQTTSPTSAGCCASTSCMSPTSPTR